MAEIKHDTPKFCSGCALSALDFAEAKSAGAEVQRNLCIREVAANG